ncbi:MAG: phage portal protein [Thermoguttaceae bacterium]|nr:phage portal protein [Thermoguttaceae bacterium]
MGLFDSIFGTKEKRPPGRMETFKTFTTYQPTFRSWGGKIYESDLVRAAINARAVHISKLKFEWVGAAQPKLQTTLRKRPNQYQTWSQFLYRCSTILDNENTLFIVPVTDMLGDTVGIYPVIPTECRLLESNGVPWLEYYFNGHRRVGVEYSRCGIMTKFQYKDDFFGENNRALHDTMALIDLQHKGISEAIKSRAAYKFMARVGNFTKPEDLADERERFNSNNMNGNGGGLLLFPNTYNDIKQIDPKNYVVDAAQMRQIEENVFNYFGVNDDILKNQAYGDKWNAFYESAIEPFAIQFSEVITQMLLSAREQTDNIIMLSSNRLQYLSNTEKLNISTQMLDRGAMNADEVREMWNLPPLPYDEGKVYRIRAEYVATDEQDGGTLTNENE